MVHIQNTVQLYISILWNQVVSKQLLEKKMGVYEG